MSDSRFRPSTKIVPRAEMDSIQDSAAYLTEARKILADANDKAGALAVDAKRTGLEEGLKDTREQLWPLLERAVQEARDSIAVSEQDLLSIVRNAVEMIIGDLDDQERTHKLLRQALQQQIDMTAVSIEVAPADLALVRDEMRLLNLPGGTTPAIQDIRTDPVLRPGEVVIVTPKGRIQVGLRHQLDKLIEGLKSSG